MVVCPYNGTLPKTLRKISMHLSERTLELFYSVNSKNAIFCEKKKGGDSYTWLVTFFNIYQ